MNSCRSQQKNEDHDKKNQSINKIEKTNLSLLITIGGFLMIVPFHIIENHAKLSNGFPSDN
jgi:hypothetical protein